MKKTEKAFIELLSSHINDTVNISDDNPDWDEIYTLSKDHNLSGMIYLAINKLNIKPDKELYVRLSQAYFHTIAVSVNRDAEYEKVKEIFFDNKIPYIQVKGIALAEYYPVKEVRTMGDVDLVIRLEDKEKVLKLFTDKGYKSKTGSREDWTYYNDIINLEMHTDLCPEQISASIDPTAYFKNIWEMTNDTDDCFKELKPEYHLIFLLIHLAKHIYGFGAGVRQIMDISILLKHFNNQINWGLIEKDLEKLNMTKFAKNIFYLCNDWFGTQFPFELEMDQDTYELICRYIFEGGVFGFKARNSVAEIKLRKEIDNNKGRYSKKAPIKAFLKLFVIDKQDLYASVPFTKRHPFLLPIGWVYRIFRGVFSGRKRERHKAYISGLSSKRQEAQSNYDIMKKIGL